MEAGPTIVPTTIVGGYFDTSTHFNEVFRTRRLFLFFRTPTTDDVLTEQLKTGDVLLFSRRWTQMLVSFLWECWFLFLRDMPARATNDVRFAAQNATSLLKEEFLKMIACFAGDPCVCMYIRTGMRLWLLLAERPSMQETSSCILCCTVLRRFMGYGCLCVRALGGDSEADAGSDIPTMSNLFGALWPSLTMYLFLFPLLVVVRCGSCAHSVILRNVSGTSRSKGRLVVEYATKHSTTLPTFRSNSHETPKSRYYYYLLYCLVVFFVFRTY